MRGERVLIFSILVILLSSSVVALSTSASSSTGGGSYASIAKDRTLIKRFSGDLVESLKFELNERIYSGMPFAKKIKEVPEVVEDYLVYEYFEIESDIPDERLKFAEIKFHVDMSWVEKNDLNKEDVGLLRYKEKWSDEGISVDFVEEDESYYVASVPGFSYFAIVGEKSVEIEEEITEQVVKGNVSVEIINDNVEEDEANIMVWVLILVILVIIIWAFVKHNHKKK